MNITTANKPMKENINGILLVDKPQGISSNRCLQKVKYLFNAKKAGHGGALDPLATGLLIVFFGEATKFSTYMLEADKHYVVTAKLGIQTESGDAEGEVVAEQDVPQISQDDLQKCICGFLGDSEQIPSMFSALKHNGQPLYKLARQGIVVDRPARSINIAKIELLNFNPEDNLVSLEVICSKGTYIRTLVEDIALKLGTLGHVTSLRRLSSGDFSINDALTITDLESAIADKHELTNFLLDTQQVVSHFPKVIVPSSSEFYLKNGRPVSINDTPTCGWVQLVNFDNSKFLGIGEIVEHGMLAPRKLISSQ